MTRFTAAGVVVLLLAAACGDDDEDAALDAGAGAGAEEDAPADGADDSLEGGSDCLVDADTVGEAVGQQVEVDGPVIGGTGSGGLESSIDTEGIEVTPTDGYSVAWYGCTFESADGTSYMVGELTDEDGNPDLSGFEQLLSWADTRQEEPATASVGEESSFDGEELVVRDAGRTMVVSFGFGSTPEAELGDGLAMVAAAMVELDSDDLVSLCDAGIAAAPAAWGELDAPLLGSGSGASGGVEYSYESCTANLPDGRVLQIKLGDADLYDVTASAADESEQEAPELVDGVGDAAVRMGDRLYVQMGDRAAAVSATVNDEPGAAAEVDALAAAVVATLG